MIKPFSTFGLLSMQVADYLIDTFYYNDKTNRALLHKMARLTDKGACMKLFSHLINCQYKWMAGIVNDAAAMGLSWWEPVYPFGNLEEEWGKSLESWLQYMQFKTVETLSEEVQFTGFDGGRWAVTHCTSAKLPFHSSPGSNTDADTAARYSARLCRLYWHQIQEDQLTRLFR